MADASKIIKIIKDKFGVNSPVQRCFILDDGSFISTPKIGTIYEPHYELDTWLIKQGLISNDEKHFYFDKLHTITCNGFSEFYCLLPKDRPTDKQLESLRTWLDKYFVSDVSDRGLQIVIAKNFNDKNYVQQHYTPGDVTSDEIIEKIKRYYTSGILTEDVTIKGDEFNFTLEDICNKYPEIVSNTYKSCGPAYIMPDGRFLLLGGKFYTHEDLAFQALMDIEKYTEEDIENIFDTGNLTEVFTKFFKLVRVNDGTEESEDRIYFVIPYNSIPQSQMNSVQNFIDYILNGSQYRNRRWHHLSAFVGNNYAWHEWDLANPNLTSDEVISDVKFAMTRGFFGESLTETIHLVDKENKNVFYTDSAYDLKNYIVNNVSKDVIKICDYVSQGLYVFCNAYNGIHEMLEEMAQEQGLVDSSNDVRYVAYTGTTEDDDYETIDYSDGIVYDYGDFKIFEVTQAMGKSKFIGSRLQRALGQFKSKYRLVNGSFRRVESLDESKQDIEKFRQWAGDELANRFFKLKDRLPDRTKDIYYWMSMEKQFLNLKNRYKSAQERSDISNYEKWAHEHAINGLKLALDNVEQTPTRREVNKLGKAGSEKIYEDDNWLVLKINTYEASVKYGKGTEWCITGNNSDQGRDDFNHHTKDFDATIYFFINKKNKNSKYALEYVDDENWCLFDETDFPHVGYGTPFNNGMDAMGGECWHKGDARDTFPVIKGLPDINKAYDDFERLDESLLLEKNRQELINKSRESDNYKSKDRQGENRYTRRLRSQIANSVRDYNRIDMDAFWKGDILDFDVRVHGETDDYVVSLDFSNILRRLQQEVSANKNRLEFKCVLRALVGAFNSDSDLLVSCTCPDWKYRQAYWATKGGYNSGQPQPSNGMAIANPNDTKGAGCKHVNLVLSNLDWMMKIASVINNYIKWTRDNMGRNYADYIFPKVYGMPYKKAVQLSLLDKEDKFGDAILPSDVDTINQAIERGMIGKDSQGKFTKGNEYRFQKTSKQAPEDNPDQIKLDLDSEEEDKEVNKSVADIEKEKNVRFTKDEPQEPEEDEEANIKFEK